MTEAQKSTIAAMMVAARNKFEDGPVVQEAAAIQAYASCVIALQLDRIATALECSTTNYDPNVSTALNRIAQATEGLESVLPRQ